MSSDPLFIHLRCHSAYSLSEGAMTIKQLAKLAHGAEMPALGIADSGNLFGALEFSDSLSEKGIQPIIGLCIKLDLSPAEAGPIKQHMGLRHLPSVVLLAKDETGYLNLMKLTSSSFLDVGSQDEPHITWALLESNHTGLICLSGGPSGPLNTCLVQGQRQQADELASRFHNLFGDRFYIELQRHGLETERVAESGLISIAYDLSIPLVATNQPYFATAEDFAAHDALICISEGEVIAAEERRRLTPEHFFKSQREMATLFADVPEAVESTVEIACRCAFLVNSRAPILPRFGEGDEAEELRHQAREGLRERLNSRGPVSGVSIEDYEKRLDYELDVITKMNFPGYFLIVADFIKYAKQNGIPVGPGRGSGAGSLVAYVLTITDLDPFRFNLLFERFLNPERVSMPDFDIDFCQDRRDEVISYVQKRFGEDRVAQIITFGKLQARMVTRDVGRVLQMSYGHVDRLSKMIPNNPANPVTLQQAIEGEPRLQEERDRDPTVKSLFDIALKLEGLYRNASTHAAGIVIGDRPLQELVPLYRDPRSGLPATQFNMKYVEKAGLVKFDFLGLKTLTVIDKSQQLIRRREPAFDINAIPYDDASTYDMLARGDTVGVFQLESSGMRDVLRKMRADCIEDIIAIVALYRPGPMDNIPRYIACKKGEEPPDYLHPVLEPILKETYGIMVYQEQVMQIAQLLSGYSLGEADLLRRAMGKKIKAEMDAQKERFVRGAVERNVEAQQADEIFELVQKFAGYGFNKSHAAAYAVVAYQTAYLKANYPVEFLAASMTLDTGNTDKLMLFRQEAQRLGIKVVPPSINSGDVAFTVEKGAIGYSLAALRNVGSAAIAHLVERREQGGAFASLADFARRVDARSLNRRALESLAKAGAFDCLHANRAQVLDAIDSLIGLSHRAADEQAAGQNDLFAATAGKSAVPEFVMPVRDNWLPMVRLSHEFDAVGFYLSGHPLDEYGQTLKRLGVETYAEFAHKVRTQGATAGRLAGTVTQRQERRSKAGNRFAFVGFSDPSGQFEAVCFSDTLQSARDLLEPSTSVLVRMEAELEGEDVKLRIQGVESLDKAAANVKQGVQIFVKGHEPLESISKRLQTGGRAPVLLTIMLESGREIDLSLGDNFIVSPQVRGALKATHGVVDVHDL